MDTESKGEVLLKKEIIILLYVTWSVASMGWERERPADALATQPAVEGGD